ncbi:hypothetical protein Lmor_0653 [Legionella moravica]|uniref:Uncharacterized protein n=1 Tax=Legionella moravica TaxID=39962 RepID=A0A378JYW9_9GAMM|nr:hypothetical protein Lmor_0653 [Legionella moravica]STX62672.1 Uncharacterised protein [Legionella moravica]
MSKDRFVIRFCSFLSALRRAKARPKCFAALCALRCAFCRTSSVRTLPGNGVLFLFGGFISVHDKETVMPAH